MTIQSKQTTAYVLAGLGLAASIGGIFYGAKKGYGGWGKFGLFILFGAPFNIASGALQMSIKADAKTPNTDNRSDEEMIAAIYSGQLPESEIIKYRDKVIADGTFCSKFPDECYG
jgi:hypothetical protein